MGKVEGGVEQDDVKMEKNTTVQYMYTTISYTWNIGTPREEN